MSSCPSSRLPVLMTVAAVVLAPGCRVTDIPLWGPDNIPAPCEVETVKDVCYHNGPGSDDHRNRLDLFIPRGKKDCPVVVLVHGGAWVMGDNRCCGLYSSVGEFLASQGIVAVLPNYKLSPGVKHPEHVKDVARAVAWAHAHIGDHGGRADQIFLLGHSAGGHLVSLLATDPQYLKAEGLSARDLRGVIAVSGVYRIPQGNVAVKLGGAEADAVRLDKMFPLRNPSTPAPVTLPGMPLNVDIFEASFGKDAEVRAEASPIHHVGPGLPPFLLIAAANDLPLLPEMGREFHQALVKEGCEAEYWVIPERNHNSVLFQAFQAHDPVARAVMEFITHHIPMEKTCPRHAPQGEEP